jgi:general secretion pathway protein H
VTKTQNSELKTQNCRQSGFTLIEMVVVIAIIAMAALLVLPRLPSTDTSNLRGSARSLAAMIRYLGDKSITSKSAYRLQLNLADSSLAVRKVVNGEESTDSDPFFSRRILADGISIEDVRIPRLGKLSTGEVTVGFGPSGLEDFVIIHLKGSRDNHFTVTAYPQNGKVKVGEGYQEVEP